MNQLFHTFMNSIAWHSGTKLVAMIGLPIVVVFLGYGVYKYWKERA